MELLIMLLKGLGLTIFGFVALYFSLFIGLPIIYILANAFYKIITIIVGILAFTFLWIPFYCYETIKYNDKLKRLEKELAEARLNDADTLTLSCYEHRIEEHKKNKPVLF